MHEAHPLQDYCFIQWKFLYLVNTPNNTSVLFSHGLGILFVKSVILVSIFLFTCMTVLLGNACFCVASRMKLIIAKHVYIGTFVYLQHQYPILDFIIRPQ